MATTQTQQPNKLTKDERVIIGNALEMQHTSLARSARTAKAGSVQDAFKAEAAKVQALIHRINTGELDL